MKTKASASKIKASAKTKIAAKQGFCTTCGDPVEPGEQYCDKCGKKLKGQG
jgi:predicted amidophosphoribosyltransferase